MCIDSNQTRKCWAREKKNENKLKSTIDRLCSSTGMGWMRYCEWRAEWRGQKQHKHTHTRRAHAIANWVDANTWMIFLFVRLAAATHSFGSFIFCRPLRENNKIAKLLQKYVDPLPRIKYAYEYIRWPNNVPRHTLHFDGESQFQFFFCCYSFVFLFIRSHFSVAGRKNTCC